MIYRDLDLHFLSPNFINICAPLLQRHHFLLACDYCLHRKPRDICPFCFEFLLLFFALLLPSLRFPIILFLRRDYFKLRHLYYPISFLYARNILSTSAIYKLSNARRRNLCSQLGGAHTESVNLRAW